MTDATTGATRRHPVEPLVPALGLLLVTAGSRSLVTVGSAGLLALGLLAAARIPAGEAWRFLRAPLAFGAATSLPLVVSLTGGQLRLRLTLAAGLLGLKLVAGSLALALAALTAPLPALLAWSRRAGVPPALVDLAVTVLRFLDLLGTTHATMARSQAARLGRAGWRVRLRAQGMLAGQLLLLALARAARLEQGLAARGYQGDLLMLPPGIPLDRRACLLGLTWPLLALLPGAVLG